MTSASFMANMSALFFTTIDMSFLSAIAHFPFLQTALLVCLLTSISCAIVGSFVVVKKLSFLAGGIAHAVLGGIGAAIFFGFDHLIGAMSGAVLAALLMGSLHLKGRDSEDTLIAALWALGMAVGLIFIALTPGYTGDLHGILFGNVLLIPQGHVWALIGLNTLLLIVVLGFYRVFLAIMFDQEMTRLRGVPVKGLYLLFLVMISVTVVMLIQVVGLILVIALLTLPSAIALHYVHSIFKAMFVAAVLAFGFCLFGLGASYELNLPPGPVIIVAASLCYLCSSVFYGRMQRRRAMTVIKSRAA